MKICEILSVGSELLLGDTVDTNASYLSQKMREVGYAVYYRQTCGDHRERLRETMELALSRSDLVIATGGLGPTYDDITRDLAGEVMEMPLEENEAVAEKIRSYFRTRGYTMSDNNLRQAQVPKGAVILENDWGTAPGLYLEKGDKAMILLPGVPREMKALFTHRVAPLLKGKNETLLVGRVLHFYGIGESLLDDRLGDLMREAKNPTVAPFALSGEVELHLTASALSETEGESMLDEMKEKILSLVGEFCYGEGELTLEKALVTRFSQKGITLSTAESCTGGLLSQRITAVSGASSVLQMGLAAYQEEVKENLLGVSHELLAKGGVYSKDCALQMAEGVRLLGKSQLGIGITGIAGPDGETETDPVGTVYIAVTDGKRQDVCRTVFPGRDREHIRYLAASKALAMALHLTESFRERAQK